MNGSVTVEKEQCDVYFSKDSHEWGTLLVLLCVWDSSRPPEMKWVKRVYS